MLTLALVRVVPQHTLELVSFPLPLGLQKARECLIMKIMYSACNLFIDCMHECMCAVAARRVLTRFIHALGVKFAHVIGGSKEI